jgi:hypothetical protein
LHLQVRRSPAHSQPSPTPPEATAATSQRLLTCSFEQISDPTPDRNSELSNRTRTSAIDGAVGCGFCRALRELLSFDWDADRPRFSEVADSGGCFHVAPGIAFVRIQVDDEYGLYAPADPVTGLALPGQRSLWFRDADMVVEGANEPAG